MLTVYSLDGCPFCEAAIKLLIEKDVKHKVIKITQKNKDKYKKDLDVMTFPQLILNSGGKCYKLGGYEDLERIMMVCDMLCKANINSKAVDYICKCWRS